jgi:site-specific DNA-methyltransferase (adenine-specific)
VTPYYERNGVTLYHGDSRELLPLVKATVLVTDPPYGVGFSGKATKHTSGNSGGYTTPDDPDIGPEIVRLALPLVKRGAVFPGQRNLFAYPVAQDIGGVYCPSGAGMGSWGFRCFHPVLFYGKRPPGTIRPSCIESFDVAEPNGHPCPKPIRWMRWAIAMTCRPGDVPVDPFAGSGTTLRAAKDLGFQAVGIEREERYCEIAARRLEQDVLPLFGDAA